MEEQFKKRLILNFSVSLIFAAIVVLFYKFIGFLLPLVLAVIVAILGKKIGKFLAKHMKISEKFATVFSVFCIFAIILLFVYLFFYLLFYLGTHVFEGFGGFVDFIENFFLKLSDAITNIGKGLSPDISKAFAQLGGDLITGIGEKVLEVLYKTTAATVKMVPSFMLGLLFSLVAGCYIAKDFEKWKKFFINILNESQRDTVRRVSKVVCESLSGIFKGYLRLFLLTFFELFIGFWILGINHSFAVAILIAIVDLLPILGTGIVLVPWGIISLITGNSLMGVGLILLSLIITSVRYFAEPKIIGKQIGVHPLVTLITIFLGLRFFGFAGLITLPLIVTVLFNYYKADP